MIGEHGIPPEIPDTYLVVITEKHAVKVTVLGNFPDVGFENKGDCFNSVRNFNSSHF